MEPACRKVLFIDNFDSFTYNLVDDFAKRQCLTKVYRADTSLDDLQAVAAAFDPDLLVISPGPGNPDTAGVSLAAVDYFQDKLPIFGVCLGMQCINEAFGGRTVRSPAPMHGKTSFIRHNDSGVFHGMPDSFTAARYHSLICEPVGDELIITAYSDDGRIMGISHPVFPLHGVQFHPESFLTEYGFLLIENFLRTGTSRERIGND